jgi:phosphoadenosine phosphosulfate reductase
MDGHSSYSPITKRTIVKIERIARIAAEERAAELTMRYGMLDGEALLGPILMDEFPGTIAATSSFGAEAALLLHMMAQIDPGVPVLFTDTGKLFGETLRYRDRLVAQLGLTDVRTLSPDAAEVAQADGDMMLWQRDPDACCAIRKIIPMRRALAGFEAWISGRKRFQSESRAALPAIEAAEGMVKINPLVRWGRDRIAAESAARGLPRHPLEADGFLSIGCFTCTRRVGEGEDGRAGRWDGVNKTECGLHTLTARQVRAITAGLGIDGDGI